MIDEKKIILEKFWPELKLYRHHPTDHMIIFDIIEKRLYDIVMRDETLYCEQDQSIHCKHTTFVWMYQGGEEEISGFSLDMRFLRSLKYTLPLLVLGVLQFDYFFNI